MFLLHVISINSTLTSLQRWNWSYKDYPTTGHSQPIVTLIVAQKAIYLTRSWQKITLGCLQVTSDPLDQSFQMSIISKNRGHLLFFSCRFIWSSPGKTKAMTSSVTGRMVSSDNPLYLPCPACKSSKDGGLGSVSQLMRIHVVTPKAPVNIYVCPRVSPCPEAGPTFIPGWSDKGVKLPVSTYWVLRMPLIYWGKWIPKNWTRVYLS